MKFGDYNYEYCNTNGNHLLRPGLNLGPLNWQSNAVTTRLLVFTITILYVQGLDGSDSCWGGVVNKL